MAGPKKIFVKTFGCQMNVYDSERMTELLGADGFAETHDDGGRRRRPPQHLPHPREGRREGLFRSRPHPPGEGAAARARARRRSSRLPAAWPRRRAPRSCAARRTSTSSWGRRAITGWAISSPAPGRRGAASSRPAFPRRTSSPALPRRAPTKAVTAFLTVQEGCDKFCTFCVVPYTRGAEFSRPVAEVEAEARRLADHGVREVTLLGQNVNAYHGLGPDGRAWTLAELIARLALIGGLERIRYTTSHPRDMGDDLIAAHRDQPKLMPYLHLPFQAGADRILAAMNRKHTAADYLAAGRAHPRRPSRYGVVHRYHRRLSRARRRPISRPRSRWWSGWASPRPTPSSTARVRARRGPAWPIRSPKRSKSSRLHRLQQVLAQQQSAFNSACIGRVVPVLFEREGRHPGQLIGRSPYSAGRSRRRRAFPAGVHRRGCNCRRAAQ